MLQRFYLLRVYIKKALIDIRNKDESLDLSYNESQMLLDMITDASTNKKLLEHSVGKIVIFLQLILPLILC